MFAPHWRWDGPGSGYRRLALPTPVSRPRSTPRSAPRSARRRATKRRFRSPLEETVARIADGSGGRIGVYAVDLATGKQVSVLGDQRFPMASTSKIAIAATFLEQAERGR